MNDEPRFTLAEARREMQRQACLERGHDWNILSTVGAGPYALHCPCGEKRQVVRYPEMTP